MRSSSQRKPDRIMLETESVQSETARVRSKGCLSNKTALAMIFKLAEAAEKNWRRLDGHNQLPNDRASRLRVVYRLSDPGDEPAHRPRRQEKVGARQIATLRRQPAQFCWASLASFKVKPRRIVALPKGLGELHGTSIW
jgi:hypothetical protein